ncbi:hypothetical protein MTO96_031267 [Rhipicephalus appendiculatus]
METRLEEKQEAKLQAALTPILQQQQQQQASQTLTTTVNQLKVTLDEFIAHVDKTFAEIGARTAALEKASDQNRKKPKYPAGEARISDTMDGQDG